jgi:sugar transferase EpsL
MSEKRPGGALRSFVKGSTPSAIAKRVVDVLGASLGLCAVAPVMGAAAVAVRASMGSPVLWKQVRPGLHGEPFTMYKFRTMRPAKDGEVWFRTDADRLTPVGRFLRKTSIDELPELLNVLLGDMSLVGPRPLLMEYLQRYTPEQHRRHEVRPGITGWAQVNGRQSIPFSKRLSLDVWYVDHQSLFLDVKILAMTVKQAVLGSGVISGQNVDSVDDLGLSAAVEVRRAH